MSITVSFQRGFSPRSASPAAPVLFDTTDLSDVSPFATPRPPRLIPCDRPSDARQRREMIQPDVPAFAGAK
jgi:hypothetical protein